MNNKNGEYNKNNEDKIDIIDDYEEFNNNEDNILSCSND